jgi:hypothetical protein
MMKLTTDNIHKVNFAGLVLTFSRVAAPETAAKLHTAACPAGKQTSKIERIADAVVEEVVDLLDREYGVTLCRCARAHKDVR